jgi:hypothetical protein
MGTQDKTETTTEADLLDMVAQTLEAALEDGEAREDLGHRVGIDALATADFHRTNRPGVVTVQFANGETWELTTTARVKCHASRLSLLPMAPKNARKAGRVLAESTDNAYSFDLYYSRAAWTQIATRLLVRGYSVAQTECVLRSKYMRWAHDSQATDKAPRMTLAKWEAFYANPNVKAGIESMLREEGLA